MNKNNLNKGGIKKITIAADQESIREDEVAEEQFSSFFSISTPVTSITSIYILSLSLWIS